MNSAETPHSLTEEILDVAIVGGGMVGSSLALALSALPLKVAVIEPHPQNSDTAPGFDARAIALSWGSSRIFNGLGIWQHLREFATPIKTIHVSDRGYPGICRLNAEQFNVSALGQVVELEAVGKVIHQALARSKTQIFCPATVEEITYGDEYSTLTFKSGQKNQQIKARLVVAADGNHSAIRKMSGISVETKPYDQVAIISTIQTQLPHNNTAYERFTRNGPVAFLPLSKQRISLVWMMDAAIATQRLELSEQDFIQQLQQQFGYRLGSITQLGERFSYPLNLVKAARFIGKRLVMIGNAAQSLHPIAGQGFNLGLRDVATLADILRSACLEDLDPGSQPLLERYQQLRQGDRKRIVDFTDTLARLFANPATLLSAPRNIILMAMNVMPQMRGQIAEAAMGLSGRQPRLVRGLSLALDEDCNYGA